MKKQIMTIAIVLGLSMTSFAQGGLFHRGANADGTPAEIFSDLALMEREGLDVPETVRLQHDLRAAGMVLPDTAL